MHGIAAIGESIFGLIANHGYAALLWILAVEEAGVPLPIPGDLLLVYTGYLVLIGKLEFWKSVFTSVLGSVFGATVLFSLFKYGGRPLALKYGKYMLLSKDRLVNLETWFNKKGKWAVVFGRFLPYARVFISAVAGLSGLKYIYFLPQIAIASFVWALGFTYLGILLGKRWQVIFEGSKTGSFIFLLIFVIIIVTFIIREKKKSQLRK